MNLFLIHQARLCCRFVGDFMESRIAYFWNELSDRYPQWQGAGSSFAEAVSLLVGCVKNHGKILICGNGGSAADAEHIAGELMKSFLLPRSLPESFCSRAKKLYPQHADALTRLQGGIAAIPLVSGRQPLPMMWMGSSALPSRCMLWHVPAMSSGASARRAIRPMSIRRYGSRGCCPAGLWG